VLYGLGIVRFVLRRCSFPLAPIMLGLVLGPLLETEFRRALIGSRGDWTVFVSTPLAITLLGCSLLMIGWPLLARLWRTWHPEKLTGQKLDPA
jgi:putative tricarboxylic transport membrane protein